MDEDENEEEEDVWIEIGALFLQWNHLTMRILLSVNMFATNDCDEHVICLWSFLKTLNNLKFEKKVTAGLPT